MLFVNYISIKLEWGMKEESAKVSKQEKTVRVVILSLSERSIYCKGKVIEN